MPEGGPQVESGVIVRHDEQDPWPRYRPHSLTGRVGTVVRYVEVHHRIIIYVMLEVSYAEGPFVVVKGAARNFMSFKEAEE